MTTRNLLSGPITLSDAAGRSTNVLHSLQYPLRKLAFYNYLEGRRGLLAEVIAHHLGTKPTDIEIYPQAYWRHGSFNLCVPFQLNFEPTQSDIRKVGFIRFPLPYRVGEVTNPGNSDEKLQCEAATYAWLEENCPSIPIPKLYGFGLSTNQRFTKANLLPWWSRWYHYGRRFLSATLGLEQPSQYVCHASGRLAALDTLDTGYLLIEAITSGKMLSESWEEKRDDAHLYNLQRDLAKVMVSLARIRLPRIGSFRMDSNGYIRLDNRPISVQSTIQENEGITPSTSRHMTFSSVKEFVLHQVAAYETRFLEQLNAIVSRGDAWYQMTGLAAAKVVLPQLLRDDLCNGPFVFSLTDLHRSNIFVDEDWNITCIIDLEFACSWPVEFIQTPHWLEVEFIDQVTPTNLAPRYTEFLEHIRREEGLQQHRGLDAEPLSSILQRSWDNGAFWVPLTLRDPITFGELFFQRVLKGYFDFTTEELEKAENYIFCSRLFRRNLPSIIDRKLDDQKRYLDELTKAFADAPVDSS